jgi:hypothetical protein
MAAHVGDAASRPSAGEWFGGIVPHAGWIASGAIAGQVIATLAGMMQAAPDLVVVFGAVHTPLRLSGAALPSHDKWREPCEDSPVAVGLVRQLGEQSMLFSIDDRFHDDEHAVEVELPLIQQVWPGTMVLPVEVPLDDQAVEVGRRTALAVRDEARRAIFLASSDLTHYGPAYRFAPAGVGPAGLDWAMDNDRRLLEVIAGFSVEAVVPTVRAHHSACGGGAIAAMLAACREQGADTAVVMRHANSYLTLAEVVPQTTDNAVGYAAVVVGRQAGSTG